MYKFNTFSLYYSGKLDELLVFFFEEKKLKSILNNTNISEKVFKNITKNIKKVKKLKKKKLKYKINFTSKFKNFFNIFTLTKQQLLNFVSYLGHTKKKQRLNFLSYLYGIRNDLIIFNQDFSLLFYKRSLRFFFNILLFQGKGYFLTNFVNNGFFGMAQYILKTLKQAFFDGLYVGGVVSNYQNVSKLKKRYFFEYAFNFRTIKRILPSLIIISSTNNYYYAFHESMMLGIPSVGFIDTDLEFFDSFYPILVNNENKSSDFFLLISFSSVIKNSLIKKRLNILKIKLKFLQFCFRFYIYLLFLKFNKISFLQRSIYLIVNKNMNFFFHNRLHFIFTTSKFRIKKTSKYFFRYFHLQNKNSLKVILFKFFKKQYFFLKSFFNLILYKNFVKKKIEKKKILKNV